MEWDQSHTTAALSGPQSGKVSAAVSYPDTQTVVLAVNSDFGSAESFTLSGLAFMNFGAGSNPNPDALRLEVLNDGATQAIDSHTIRIQDVTAFDDNGYAVTTGSALNVAAPGVLANDTEIANHPLTAALFSGASHGLATVSADGSFSYTPVPHFVGTDTFTYVANNGTTNSLPATVTIMVNKAVLTVTANDASMLYGAHVPTFTFSFTGFVSGDIAASIAGVPALTTPATSSSNVGLYSIVPSPGTLSSSTYTFSFVPGMLAIGPAPLSVSANDIVKAYGAAIPALPYSFSGFCNGDTASVLTGTPLVTTTATAESLEGTFPISLSAGTLAAMNYAFTFNPGILTIVPSPPVIGSIMLTPNPASTGQSVNGSAEIMATQGVSATVLWDFGDGTSATGLTIQHAWTDAGIYTVTITATSPDKVATSASTEILISLTAGSGGAGTDPLGGVVIGSDPASSKFGKATAKLNFAQRNKTSLSCTVNGLNFPKTLQQADLLLFAGTLTVGPADAAQQTYQFTLDKNGHASATGVKFALTTKKGSLSFTVSGREGLTTLFESLGATSTPAVKGSAPIPIVLPATLRIGTKIFLAMTFKL
jgi:PKD repeat protein